MIERSSKKKNGGNFVGNLDCCPRLYIVNVRYNNFRKLLNHEA